jgi:catechol 2,3-dioxygenase
MSTAPDDAALAPHLPATLRLGPVHLTVSNLDTSVSYYERVLGLKLHDRDGDVATLGAGGEDLLVLVEEAGAAPGGRHAGLFHFALLHPTRRELAYALRRVADTGTRLAAASDHGISEAIYLRDPDHHGVEIYADRPRDDWPPPDKPEHRVGVYTIALDVEDLLREIQGEEPPEHAGPGLRMGHVHLHVGDVERSLAFYRDLLGFEIMAGMPGAAFVSAGGYHHHLGLNVWLGPDVEPLPPRTAGLRHWTILLSDPGEIDDVRARVEAAGLATEPYESGFLARDPWNTAVVFGVG